MYFLYISKIASSCSKSDIHVEVSSNGLLYPIKFLDIKDSKNLNPFYLFLTSGYTYSKIDDR